MIDSKKKILIYDDTGSGDDFEIEVLYEDDGCIVGNAFNEWYDSNFKIMIIKDDFNTVVSKDLQFYLAKND